MTGAQPTIACITLSQVRVSPKTIWLFVATTDSTGAVGIGEATLQKSEAAVVAALALIAPALYGQPADPRRVPRTALDGMARPAGAAWSALDQSLWDLAGQRAGQSVAHLLGPATPEVELYANINRGLASREPAAFGAAAATAVAAGFHAVKIAPFDEIDTYGRWGAVVAPQAITLDRGLARIAATRAAIGNEVDLMIDCHWRFDEAWGERVLDAVAALQLYWVECPIPETENNLDAIARLRLRANRHDMLLAGGEDGVGRGAFMPFLDHDCYDVLMPDIKYVGGLDEMRTVADLAAQHDVTIAPHNPTGPVAHAASLHVCAGLTGFSRLELQYNESPLFDSLVSPRLAVPREGRALVPTRAGLGIALASEVAAKHVIGQFEWNAAGE